MLIDLANATPATSGGKAPPLARLHAAGLPVPPGFVVPTRAYEEAIAGVDVMGAAYHDAYAAHRLVEPAVLAPALVDEISAALARITDPSSGCVAVRSSASSEDTADVSAAGQHDTFLGVRGPDDVADAIRRCWASLWSQRAVEYRQGQHGARPGDQPVMAVLVQRLVDAADVAGVLFTGATLRVEASWGLGESVVGGAVTPDSWVVTEGAVIDRAVGRKDSRMDRDGTRVVTRRVLPADRDRPCLTDNDVLELARLGGQIEEVLGPGQDVEWAIADNQIWILQARPITASLPVAALRPKNRGPHGIVFTGTPASAGLAKGPARVVRGPSDFTHVRPGDILVCRTTDPAWTPLFAVVAAVVTETGGLLSHAAIVARERGLPAVLAVPRATTVFPDGETVQVDGRSGRVLLTQARPTNQARRANRRPIDGSSCLWWGLGDPPGSGRLSRARGT